MDASTIRAAIGDVAGQFFVAGASLDAEDQVDLAGDEPVVAASVIKVPIMVEAFRQWEAGLLDLGRRVTLRHLDKVGGSGILQNLSDGAEFSLLDLVRLMIQLSDNTATNMVLAAVGMANVNRTAAALGLRHTRVENQLMVVPQPPAASNTVSAADMARLLTLVARGQVVSLRSCRLMVDIMLGQQLNDLIPAGIPQRPPRLVGELPAVRVAHKTGSLADVRHDVGIVYAGPRTYVLAVLSRGLADVTAAEAAIRRISAAVYERWGRA